ncbi:MAG: M23 family metallopeptidase [bacterium]|nr:M23 family metallopeptidase [bacterium]
MNPTFYLFIFSYKQVFKYVFYTFLIVLSLPLIAILVITRTGIQTVSDKLATVNLNDQVIEIHDPASGKVLTTLHSATTWPVKGVITLKFGESDLPYQALHTGIDIASPRGKTGDPITPFMKGKVIYADELSWGYGKHIIIDHGNNVTSVYAHLDSIKVRKDQEVSVGDILGTEGQTGWATGPHLHFEIRVSGVPVNPNVFLGSM